MHLFRLRRLGTVWDIQASRFPLLKSSVRLTRFQGVRAIGPVSSPPIREP
jgi:hypothetical protein